MNIKATYINLPVRDLTKTRQFWNALGFTFYEQFCDNKALCLELKKDTIYAMLITHEFFKTFTNRPIAENTTTQVLLAIEVKNKEQVNQIVQAAFANGGQRYREAADHEWMYYDSFVDIDGHQWEVMCTDTAKLQESQGL